MAYHFGGPAFDQMRKDISDADKKNADKKRERA